MLDRNQKPCQIVPPMAKSSTRKILVTEEEEEEEEARGILYSSSSSSPHWFLLVCGCRTAIFTLTLLLSSLLFTFSEASRPIITPSSSLSSSSPTNPPTPSPLKTSHGIHVDPKILTLVITFSALLTSLILFMALFKCFGFKLKRNHNRVGTAMETYSTGGDSDIADDEDNKKGEEYSVRKFSWDEIARFTNNFSTVIGSGGYSTVYLAHSPDSGHRFWAIKIHNGSERLNQVFRQELDILLRLGHQNIVKLLGYCDDREEGALVFEYVANGNLQEILHGEEQSVLPWKNRMLIAYQIAQAISYLHEQCALQIVHMDIKASNVLLDKNLNSKLCDFGSAKMGFSSTVQPPSPALKKQFLMMGSPGYTDPHYMRTGFASKKNDVYSFGVLLLELVTGMEAFCPQKGQMLTSLVGPRLMDGGEEIEEEVAAGMVDRRLGSAGGFDVEEARTMLSLAATCLRQSPTLRPSVTKILQTITDRISTVEDEEEESHRKSVKSLRANSGIDRM